MQPGELIGTIAGSFIVFLIGLFVSYRILNKRNKRNEEEGKKNRQQIIRSHEKGIRDNTSYNYYHRSRSAPLPMGVIRRSNNNNHSYYNYARSDPLLPEAQAKRIGRETAQAAPSINTVEQWKRQHDERKRAQAEKAAAQAEKAEAQAAKAEEERKAAQAAQSLSSSSNLSKVDLTAFKGGKSNRKSNRNQNRKSNNKSNRKSNRK